ncbi:MAG: sulfite exporter TauE/SafE family protein [Gemmatimonadaceae bacterium]|nr:sulfite exporter TauE/SafE family protein [Gemmatimonadaceae bacterium]
MNLGILTFVSVGFLVGFRHAFEPDHLAAVTTLATRERGLGHAARLGVAWGVGHTASVAVVAIALILLGVHVPPHFHRLAELGVAVLLVALGVSTLLAEARRHRLGLGMPHAYAHAAQRAHSHDPSIRTVSRSLWFGVAHGMAGSGAVIALLVAAASSVEAQFGYLAAFGLGTVAGMSMVSLLTGAVSALAAARSARVARHIRIGSALASSLVGVMLGWRTVVG